MSGTVLHVGATQTLDSVVFHQLVGLRERGWDIVVACTPDRWAARIRAEGFAIAPIAMPGRPSPQAIRRDLRLLPAALRDVRPALVHTHNAHHGVVARIAARTLGIPSVHTWRYSPLDASSAGAIRGAYALAEGLAARAGEAVLFQNPEDRDEAVRLRIVPRERAHMIGNGIRIELYQQPARPPEQVRSELGIAPTDRVVLCVGRLEERKHQADLLEALPELTGELPMQLLLVGTGSDRDRLAERAAALGIPDRVHFLGQRPDIADLLHAADIFALPSRREGVPRAVMEAMAARVPVVATDVVGTREVVKDDVTGLLVPFGEPGALAGALRRVLLDEALATRLVASAHVALTRDWREELVVERVDAAYRSLLDGDAR